MSSLQVNRSQNSSVWTLQIKYPQLRDAGVYECQINSEPKMSLSYSLEVIGEYQNIFMNSSVAAHCIRRAHTAAWRGFLSFEAIRVYLSNIETHKARICIVIDLMDKIVRIKRINEYKGGRYLGLPVFVV